MTGSEEDLQNRLSENKWPIYKHTPNKSNTSIGDVLIFYVGGLRISKCFIGSAVIASDLMQVDTLNYYLMIRDIRIWKKSVLMYDVVNDLLFIKNKANWGAYLRSGMIRITSEDYESILRQVEQ